MEWRSDLLDEQDWMEESFDLIDEGAEGSQFIESIELH
jgi:hypothetical protein